MALCHGRQLFIYSRIIKTVDDSSSSSILDHLGLLIPSAGKIDDKCQLHRTLQDCSRGSCHCKLQLLGPYIKKPLTLGYPTVCPFKHDFDQVMVYAYK